MQNKQSIKQYLLRSGIWAVVGKLITALLGFILSTLLARLLSPQDMGVYFLAFNLVSFFAICARFGLENTLLFYISDAFGKNRPETIKSIIYKGLGILILSSFIISQLFYLKAGELLADLVFKSPLLAENIAWIALWIIVLAFQMVLSESLRAFQDIRNATVYGGLFSSLSIVIMLAGYQFIKDEFNLTLVFFITITAGFFNLALSLKSLFRKLSSFYYSEKFHQSIINHALPLAINNIMFFIMAQSDIWILGMYKSDQEVAIYGAAARLIALVTVSLMIVNQVTPPLIGRLNAQCDKNKLEFMLRTTATFAGIPATMVITLFLFAGKNVLQLTFGDYYSSGTEVLTFLSIGQLVNVWAGSCGYTLIMTGHQRILMTISTFTGCLAILLSLQIVNSHGAAGIAFVMMCTMILQQLLMLTFVRYKCGVWTHCDLRMLVFPKRLLSQI